MVEYFTVYFPKSDRNVRIEVSAPRVKEGITFDTLYLLDGQNAFKDTHAAFGRSIRATKTLSFAANKMGKRIIGVAIHNSGSDLGRINEYTPFKIDNGASDEWEKQNIEVCMNYCYDFINTLIPFIESRYPVSHKKDHRFIYGSSLAAITAIYLGFKYNKFGRVGAFSTASFLFEKEFYQFLDNNPNNTTDVFLYVGSKETSDSMYDESIYLNSSLKLRDYLKNHNNRVRLAIDPNGIHNEETWGNHLLEFINFIYFDDTYYSPRM